MAYLTAFIELFRFIKRSRERADARLRFQMEEASRERAHQLAMLDTIFSRMVDFARTQNEGMLEIARAQTAQAGVMGEWLKGFQVSDPTPVPPQVVRDEDVWERESMESLLKELPPEFKLAFDLDKLNQASLEADGFDREGSDFN
jgi:hypothetical protein